MDFKLPKEVLGIISKFQKANFQIFIVGGAVRDLLMGREVKDWDFTTDAKPEEILKLFPKGFYNNKFGTVGIVLARGDGKRGAPSSARNEVRTSYGAASRQDPEQATTVYEITTMRKEDNYKDFRHPSKIGWTNKIGEDLARRDFTVNAMALSLVIAGPRSDKAIPLKQARHVANSPRDDGCFLIDPFNGQGDIKNKLIRAVGDPTKRFKEDALRLIRAIRISAELEFDIEKNTFLAIQKNAQLIKEVANERVRDELFKILSCMNPYIGIVKLREAEILQIILPELERCFGIIQQGPKHDRVYDIGEHSMLSLKYCPSKNPLVRFAALIHDIGKPDTVSTDHTGNVTFYNHDVFGGRLVMQISKRFNFSKSQTDKLFRLVRWHMFTVSEHQTDSAIRRFIKNVGLENIDDIMALRIGDRLGGGTQIEVSWRMEKFKKRISEVMKKPFSISDLKIDGNDVMQVVNIKPGPKVGQVLNQLFNEVLEDSGKNTREYLLKRVKLIF